MHGLLGDGKALPGPGDRQQAAGVGVEGGVPELLGIHLAEALEALQAHPLSREVEDRAADVAERHEDAAEALGVVDDDLTRWRDAAERMAVHHDAERGVHQQFAGSTDREVWDFAEGAESDAYPLLVVVPNVVKTNWAREAGRWTPHRKATVVQGNGDTVDGFGSGGKGHDV